MNMTIEQQQLLDALFPVSYSGDLPQDNSIDMLKTWLGVSLPELKQGIEQLLTRKSAIQNTLINLNHQYPLDTAAGFLAITTWAFYRAEQGVNPKITTLVDAYYYISTCASVGYADIFPVTQQGKTIASLVMTFGPALAARILNQSAES